MRGRGRSRPADPRQARPPGRTEILLALAAFAVLFFGARRWLGRYGGTAAVGLFCHRVPFGRM